MKIAVVILNWNGKHILQQYLPSVVAHSSDHAQIIVADNGSTDESLTFLAENYPQIPIIALDKNYGFAGGYNRALKQVDADYYILLNDDVEVTPNWIPPVIKLMENSPQCAICQPKLKMYDERNTFEYAGGAGGFIDKLGYPFCRGRMFADLEQDNGQYDDNCKIFWASGAAMFIKSSVWRELGGFDDDFFAHMEEIDLCWRAQNAGHTVAYCGASTVYHKGGGTLPKSSPHKTHLNFRNNLFMLYKNLSKKKLNCTIAIRLPLDYIAAIKFLLEGKPKEFAAVYRAHRDFFKSRSILKNKRKQLNTHDTECIFQQSILLHYYLKHHKKFTQLNYKTTRI